MIKTSFLEQNSFKQEALVAAILREIYEAHDASENCLKRETTLFGFSAKWFVKLIKELFAPRGPKYKASETTRTRKSDYKKHGTKNREIRLNYFMTV